MEAHHHLEVEGESLYEACHGCREPLSSFVKVLDAAAARGPPERRTAARTQPHTL